MSPVSWLGRKESASVHLVVDTNWYVSAYERSSKHTWGDTNQPGSPAATQSVGLAKGASTLADEPGDHIESAPSGVPCGVQTLSHESCDRLA